MEVLSATAYANTSAGHPSRGARMLRIGQLLIASAHARASSCAAGLGETPAPETVDGNSLDQPHGHARCDPLPEVYTFTARVAPLASPF
jgi:hypothetical protein